MKKQESIKQQPKKKGKSTLEERMNSNDIQFTKPAPKKKQELKKPEDIITIDEVYNHQKFYGEIEKVIKRIKQQRMERKPPKPGFRWVKDWFDRMSKNQHLNTDYFYNNITAIWIKQSNLNSEERRIIQTVCDEATGVIIEMIKKERKSAINKAKRDAKKQTTTGTTKSSETKSKTAKKKAPAKTKQAE